MAPYLFQSPRLGFREWRATDEAPFAAMNKDPLVMEFFPKRLTEAESASFIGRMRAEQAQKGYCYFAVDELSSGHFVGFVGLSEKTFEAPFTPAVDIGWRLMKSAWGRGLATEGAKACLDYGFGPLALNSIFSLAPKVNVRSLAVMQKIGMTHLMDFEHPLLTDSPRLQPCAVYIARKTP